MHPPRILSSETIQTIVTESISILPCFPPDIGAFIAQKHRNSIAQQLASIPISIDIIPVLKERIQKCFMMSYVQPGECIGVLAGQCIGQQQTQTTLSSFHTTGTSFKTITTSVPRFMELLNASKNFKNSTAICALKTPYASIQELRNTIAYSLVYMTFRDFVESYTLGLLNTSSSKILATQNQLFSNSTPSSDAVFWHVQLRRDLMYTYQVPMSLIFDSVYTTSLYTCMYPSPEWQGTLILGPVILNLSSLPDELLAIPICGVPGIKNYYPGKKDMISNTWIIETEGSYLPGLFRLPWVDPYHTISNSIWEIYNTLGIEACRQYLINEFKMIISADGTYVHDCHIKIIVDIMTQSGTITSISRYGLKKKHIGPLAKASFEECLDNFIKAGIFTQRETTEGVSASIMCGKQARIGTGCFDVCLDTAKTLFDNTGQ